MKTCSIKNCNYPVWSKGLCKQHSPKSPIKKANSKLKKSYISKQPSEKQLAKKEEKKERTQKLHKWFQKLWENEPHYSEISGIWLGNENSTCFWHHIFPKSTFPQAEFDRENIIRLTFQEHQEVESNPYKFNKVNEIRLKLLKKYG